MTERPLEVSDLEGRVDMFVNFVDSIKTPDMIIDVINLSDNYQEIGTRTEAEKAGLAKLVGVYIYGNNKERIKILKDVIDNHAIELLGDVGFLLNDGEIEEQEILIMSRDPRKLVELVSRTDYFFGMTAEQVIDLENRDAEPEDPFED